MPAKVTKNIFFKKLMKQKKKATSKTEKWLIFIIYNKLINNQYERLQKNRARYKNRQITENTKSK